MLKSLFIENYALIEKLDISFSEGFSVITGETGAGKSIMLGALSLILGSRADTRVLKDVSKKCIIEGHFNIESYSLKAFFSENDLDFEKITTLRREVSPTGKSRAFINDTPVNLFVLKALGDRLVNIHSQHETITLNDANFQLAVIDSYAHNEKMLEDYQNKYTQYKKHIAQLENLKLIESKTKSDLDYIQFQLHELKNANLEKNEQEYLETELQKLTHAEEIISVINEASQKIGNGELNMIDLMHSIEKSFTKIAPFHKEIDNLLERISSCLIEIKEINNELYTIVGNINNDPQKTKQISERLDLIYQLQHKHKKQTIEGLIDFMKQLSEQLNSIESIDEQIDHLSKVIKTEEEEINQLALSLSESRKQSVPSIEKKIVHMIQQLGMPNARFSILMEPMIDFGKEGIDKIKFLFNANKGSSLHEISKIASGGELSRLMLTIKSIITGRKLLPTIIFDEIDMGVSGPIADKVGEILSEMSVGMQVITITHIPQIACKGDTHFRVYKNDKGATTLSFIEELNTEQRIHEIAKMISGATITDVAVENAKILLSN